MPLRIFLGGTFTYAGLDKLFSPTFLAAGAPSSIESQLVAFARHSPIGGLVLASMPFAIEIGLAIAITEIAIGLGALSGFGFRLAAAGGLGLSILFWLTASWATRPYYYGPDLPYAAGWLTLALAGPGSWVVPAGIDRWIRGLRPMAVDDLRDRGAPARSRRVAPARIEGRGLARRTVLEAAVLGSVALVAAAITLPLRRLGVGGDTSDVVGGGAGSPTPSSEPSPEPTASEPGPTIPPGIAIATTAALARTGAAAFTIPFNAPAPLPAGNPGIVVRLPDGGYAAFDTICPHAGCVVEWAGPDGVLFCPCHGAVFDPTAAGAVLQGPAEQPLTVLPLYLDEASGTFLLRTD
ncbi:MAG: Rieske 2Fe-2S domain-containing protein [Candidatus Limnocylindrales bacterium]